MKCSNETNGTFVLDHCWNLLRSDTPIIREPANPQYDSDYGDREKVI
jgi:hypothetical protein